MKRILQATKTAALLSALSLAAAAAVPGIAMARVGLEDPGTTTVTCQGDGSSCPIQLNGNPVELKLHSVVVTE